VDYLQASGRLQTLHRMVVLVDPSLVSAGSTSSSHCSGSAMKPSSSTSIDTSPCSKMEEVSSPGSISAASAEKSSDSSSAYCSAQPDAVMPSNNRQARVFMVVPPEQVKKEPVGAVVSQLVLGRKAQGRKKRLGNGRHAPLVLDGFDKL